jgi:hypothetical protein
MHIPLAYIDPGSGSLIVQVLIATIVAVPFFFRHQISRLVRRIRPREEPPSRPDLGDPGDDPRAGTH